MLERPGFADPAAREWWIGDELDPRVACGRVGDQVACAVGGARVDEEYLGHRSALLGQSLETGSDTRGLVETGNNDREAWLVDSLHPGHLGRAARATANEATGEHEREYGLQGGEECDHGWS